MRILVLVDYYLPGYRAGGPVRSIANLVERFGGERFDIGIVTRDRDFSDAHPYPGLAGGWQGVGKAKVLYLPPARLTLRTLREVLSTTEHDLLYLNSLFSPAFTVRPLVLRRLGLLPRPAPVLLAPRGEFAPGALALSRSKKRAYLALARRARLYDNVVWHASSAYEEDDIRRVFPRDPVQVLADWPRAGSTLTTPARRPGTKRPGQLSLLFLSRVSRVKNLLGAIGLLRGIAGSVRLDVYGPIEDAGYWRECQREIDALPPNVVVTYQGVLPNHRVDEVMAAHDLFFFPSLGENFGHVILEALLAGLPVLISDRTPWRSLHDKGVGLDLPVGDAAAFQGWLRRFVDMDADEHARWSLRAMRFGREYCLAHERADETADLFRRAVAGGPGDPAGRAAADRD